MFGFGAPEFIILLVIIGLIFTISKSLKNPHRVHNNQRRCLICGYQGSMKTWIGNYNFPQFLAVFLMFFFLIPGLLFIMWGWGKYKCPTCGTLAKNVPVDFKSI